ncbi:MAG: FAD-dependent oxidoreductase, partial [Rhodospirillales bacterium]
AAENLATVVFDEVKRALGLPTRSYESFRIIREKRATFTQSAEQLKRRSGPQTALSNMFLAGDWTATGLPATIEGAVRSGHVAVAKALASPGQP